MITDIATYLPERLVTNEALSAIFTEWTPDAIYQKTGIRQRHVVEPNECASDLAVKAAEKLLAGRDRNSFDFVLFCTQTPDFPLPTTACLLQQRLGLPQRCGALDFNLGCSGYIYGLALGKSLLEARLAENLLLLNADTYTRLLDPQDRSTRPIFGDAGAATLLSRASNHRLHSFVFGTDGSGAEQLIVRAGGLRLRATAPCGPGSADGARTALSASTPEPAAPTDAGKAARAPLRPECLFMNGPEIFNFTLKVVPQLIKDILARAQLQPEQIDLFVFHQANAYMLEHLRRKLKIPKERFELCLEDCGNTVSVTIPLALERALKAGRIRPGMKILLAGFGVGLSWAGCILEWSA
jgi:3-oxoacyl-[acyl-carrier-protein] synthase-3